MNQATKMESSHRIQPIEFPFYLDRVINLLGPATENETPTKITVRCPYRKCGGGLFFVSKVNGSGFCDSEGVRRSLWEIGSLLGLDSLRLYGIFTDLKPVTAPGTSLGTDPVGLREKREDSTDAYAAALELLQDPLLTDRLVAYAEASGVVGEKDLLRTLYTIVNTRKVKNYRLHANIREESGAGKSETAKFNLSILPPEDFLHLGGGASKRALQYYGDLRNKVIFIDEANNLDEDLRAVLREAITKAEVTRLVTVGDPGKGFTSEAVTVKTEGLVLLEAGTSVMSEPADETRFLILSPDASQEQTDRILYSQAAAAVSPNLVSDTECDIWQATQGFLKICYVKIPFAQALRQLLDWQGIRSRRDFPRLLGLISGNACAHQYQRTTYPSGDDLVVVAELEDYRRVYEFASQAFSQAKKGPTRTQQGLLTTILNYRRLGEEFTVGDATAWVEKSDSTIREHLQRLEKVGILESRKYYGAAHWKVIDVQLPVLRLPDPLRLAMALFPQIPQAGIDPAHAQGGTVADVGSVPNPQTGNLGAEEDAVEI